MTVWETLMLAANFYLPTSTTEEEKQSVVLSVITELGLIKAKDTPIGNERKRGVSGGERKRCNIAVQLISNPHILFLDEPTSGLDSFQALSVMESMKTLAANGRLVISVIHQPRSSIFDMFDKLLLLSVGREAYFGDAVSARQWFADCGFPCPKLFNPSDYFLDILSLDNRTAQLDVESTARVGRLADAWAGHLRTRPAIADDDSVTTDAPLSARERLWEAVGYDWSRLYRNFVLISWRSFSEQIRNTPVLMAKLFTTCFFSSFIGAMYSGLTYNDSDIINRTGVLFIIASKLPVLLFALLDVSLTFLLHPLIYPPT